MLLKTVMARRCSTVDSSYNKRSAILGKNSMATHTSGAAAAIVVAARREELPHAIVFSWTAARNCSTKLTCSMSSSNCVLQGSPVKLCCKVTSSIWCAGSTATRLEQAVRTKLIRSNTWTRAMSTKKTSCKSSGWKLDIASWCGLLPIFVMRFLGCVVL